MLKKVYSLYTRIVNSNIASRLMKGVLWLTIGAILSRGSMLVATIIVARILGQVAFGEFGLIRSTVNIFVVFASFGMGRTTTKYIAELLVTDKERIGRIIALNYLFTLFSSSIMALIFYFLSPWMCHEMIHAPHLVNQIRFGSLLLIFSAFAGTQAGILSGFQDFRALSITTIISGFSCIPFYIIGSLVGGLHGAISGFAVSLLFNCLINSRFIYYQVRRHDVTYAFFSCYREIAILWRFSLPTVLSAMLPAGVFFVCNIMLVRQENGFNELAVFEAARQFQLSILYIPGMITQVLLPMLTEINAGNNVVTYHKMIRANLYLNGAIAAFFCVPLVFAAKYIMMSYGQGFETGTWTLVFLALCSVLMCLCNVVGSVLTSQGTIWTSFLLNLLWGIALIASASLSAKYSMGALGLAVSLLLAYLLHVSWSGVYLVFRLNRGLPKAIHQ